MSRETILPDGSIVYRTSLFAHQSRAISFARCLLANSRFTDVLVIPSQTAKEPKWYVTFRPSNGDRQGDMYQRQWNARQQRGQTEGTEYIFWPDPDRPGNYWCLSTSMETYEVGAFGCTCPDYAFRCCKASHQCKHMAAWEMQSRAGVIGKTDKVTPTVASTVETPEAFRSRMLAAREIDF